MIGTWLKKKFSKKQEEIPATEQFYTPLRIALHSTITVNTVDFVTLDGKFHSEFTLPKGQMTVVAIGTITNNQSDATYRIYVVDENDRNFIIQLIFAYDPTKGEDFLFEAMLFNQVAEEIPHDQEAWDGVAERLGATTLNINDIEYKRVWLDAVDNTIDLFVFEEKVVDRLGIKEYTNHQMLFARELEDFDKNHFEFVLIGVEESEERDVITTNIGFTIPPTNVQVQ